MELEANATPLDHDHSVGATENPIWPTLQLAQVNTHQLPDTDTGIQSIHHTLGTGATQAAPGNHAHDYEGASIFNKPWDICTSSTRPTDPQPGRMIYETDTNTARAWTAFPNNVLTGVQLVGVDFTYNFNTANSATLLDTAIFSQTYITGGSLAFGAMGAPDFDDCRWFLGANENRRCIAQTVATGQSVTASDDQVLTFTTGSQQLQGRDFIYFLFWRWPDIENPSPTNDIYLRMSANGQSYVRLCLNDAGCFFAATTSGSLGEVFLGGTRANVTQTNQQWTVKAIGGTYILYRGNQQILAAYDEDNIVNIGVNYRGWGIGMSGAKGDHGKQLTPANFTSVRIQDAFITRIPIHATEFIWQLLPMATIPHIRAEAHFRQQVIHGPKGNVIGYDTILHDWTFSPFTNFSVSQTDITIQEAGHYNIHASHPWDPDFHDFDQAGIGIAVNGQDIGRKSVSFMRGNGFAPGYPQTNELFFTYYLAKGDVVRVYAQHNASTTHWLFWWDIPPNRFTAWIELDFLSP